MSDASSLDPSSLESFNLRLKEIDDHVKAVASQQPKGSDLREIAVALHGLIDLFRDVVNRPPWLRL